MKLHWFKRSGVFFIPSTIIGWLILLAAIIDAGYQFIRIDSKSHSVSDTMMNFVFNLFIIAIVYSVIALLTSRTKA